MPGFDGTGPTGAGSMTGGASGYCNPAGAGLRTGIYRGFGFGRGGGYGRGNGFFRRGGYPGGYGRGFGAGAGGSAPAYAAPYTENPDAELNMLKARANAFRHTLETIQQRIADLEKSAQ